MDYKDLIKLPNFTKVKIKDNVYCHQIYKDGGVLIFNDELKAGIRTKKGICYQFKPEEFELIEI